MRKPIFSALFAAALAFSQKTSAQVDATANPLGILSGGPSIGVDFGVSRKFSVEGSGFFGTAKIDDTDGMNFGFNVVPKLYVRPKYGTDRFYFDLFARYFQRDWKKNTDKNVPAYTTTRFGVGVGVGWKAVTNNGFVLDLGIGFGRAYYDHRSISDNFDVTDWGKRMVMAKLGLGYRFGGHHSK